MGEQATLLCLGPLVGDVEHLQGRAYVLMDGELVLHLDVLDAIIERRGDGLVRRLWDLEANIHEATYVLVQVLA